MDVPANTSARYCDLHHHLPCCNRFKVDGITVPPIILSPPAPRIPKSLMAVYENALLPVKEADGRTMKYNIPTLPTIGVKTKVVDVTPD